MSYNTNMEVDLNTFGTIQGGSNVLKISCLGISMNEIQDIILNKVQWVPNVNFNDSWNIQNIAYNNII